MYYQHTLLGAVKKIWGEAQLESKTSLVLAVPALPFLLVACILPLQFLKAALAAAQYVNRAEEGRLAKPQDRPSHSRAHSASPPFCPAPLRVKQCQDRYSLSRLRPGSVIASRADFSVTRLGKLVSVAMWGWKSPRRARYGRVLNRSG